MIIYKTTNKINSKIYIGQTIKTLEKRWQAHCQPSMASRSLVSRAIQKYGKESFIVEEIDGANNLTELNYKEWLLIHRFNSLNRNLGYNIREGGNNSNLSNETKEKIKKARFGSKCSVKTINKMKNSWKSSSIDHFKKKVLEENTGTVYDSVTEASLKMKIPRSTLVRILNKQTNPSKKYKDIKISYHKEK